MTSPTPISADSAIPVEPARQRFVYASLVLVGCIFVIAVGLLFYKWVRVPAIVSALVSVQGDSHYDGVIILLDGSEGTFESRLNSENKFIARFKVTPGNYALRVKRGKETLFETAPARVRENESIVFRLPTDWPATAPARP